MSERAMMADKTITPTTHAGRVVTLVVAAVALTSTLAACGGGAPHRLAALDVIQRSVEVGAPGTNPSFRTGQRDEALKERSTVRTGTPGFAGIVYFDKSLTRLGPATTFTVTRLAQRKGRRQIHTRLDVGKTWNRVEKLSSKTDSFEVETPVAVASVRGTKFAVECATQECIFTVIEGVVRVTPKMPPAVPIDLHPGQRVAIGTTGPTGGPTNLAPAAIASDPWIALNQSLDAGLTFDQAANATTTVAPAQATTTIVPARATTTVATVPPFPDFSYSPQSGPVGTVIRVHGDCGTSNEFIAGDAISLNRVADGAEVDAEVQQGHTPDGRHVPWDVTLTVRPMAITASTPEGGPADSPVRPGAYELRLYCEIGSSYKEPNNPVSNGGPTTRADADVVKPFTVT